MAQVDVMNSLRSVVSPSLVCTSELKPAVHRRNRPYVLPFSTTCTFAPFSAASMAAGRPQMPAPQMTMSQSTVSMISLSGMGSGGVRNAGWLLAADVVAAGSDAGFASSAGALVSASGEPLQPASPSAAPAPTIAAPVRNPRRDIPCSCRFSWSCMMSPFLAGTSWGRQSLAALGPMTILCARPRVKESVILRGEGHFADRGR